MALYHEQDLPIGSGTPEAAPPEGAVKGARRGAFWVTAAEIILLVSLILVALIRPFVLEPFYIPSESMLPGLHKGDSLLVNRFSFRMGEPERGEVVVFYGSEESGHPDEVYVKRIIALPGEQVAVYDGKTYVQGMPLDEEYVREAPFGNYGPYRVPENSYFMMGDNRNDSRDSRYWGAIPRENLIGRAVCVFWPASRVHRIR